MLHDTAQYCVLGTRALFTSGDLQSSVSRKPRPVIPAKGCEEDCCCCIFAYLHYTTLPLRIRTLFGLRHPQIVQRIAAVLGHGDPTARELALDALAVMAFAVGGLPPAILRGVARSFRSAFLAVRVFVASDR